MNQDKTLAPSGFTSSDSRASQSFVNVFPSILAHPAPAPAVIWELVQRCDTRSESSSTRAL